MLKSGAKADYKHNVHIPDAPLDSLLSDSQLRCLGLHMIMVVQICTSSLIMRYRWCNLVCHVSSHLPTDCSNLFRPFICSLITINFVKCCSGQTATNVLRFYKYTDFKVFYRRKAAKQRENVVWSYKGALEHIKGNIISHTSGTFSTVISYHIIQVSLSVCLVERQRQNLYPGCSLIHSNLTT